MKIYHVVLLICTSLLVTACGSSDRTNAILNGYAGEEVNSICFTRQIRDWNPLNDRSIILRHNRNDYYRIDLLGTCQIQDAFVGIQLQSRSGICLNPGDRIRFDRDAGGLSCSIDKIFEWNLADMPTQ